MRIIQYNTVIYGCRETKQTIGSIIDQTIECEDQNSSSHTPSQKKDIGQE